MTRFTVTSDDRRELDRARQILSKSYLISEEKTPQVSEKQRFRMYVFAVPKGEPDFEIKQKPIKNGDGKPARKPQKRGF